MRILLPFLLLLCSPCFAQKEMEHYVKKNLSALSIAPAESDDFADLEPLRKAIGDRKVVMLGEACHGDGSAFLAKSRIIKFLHEQMGFKVLAFESDFYALTDGWDTFSNYGISIDSFVNMSVYPIWTRCDGAAPLFRHISSSFSGKNPLMLCGIDNQQGGLYSYRYMKKELDSFLQQQNIPFVRSADYPGYLTTVGRLGPPGSKLYTRGRLDTLITQTKTILNQLYDQLGNREEMIQLQALKNIQVFFEQMVLYDRNKLANDVGNRDSMMAANLEWIIKYKYPGEKIIVWAHNLHIIRNNDEALNKRRHLLPTAGYHFTQSTARRADTYIIGVTAYTGACMFTTTKLGMAYHKTVKNSFEGWCHSIGHPVGFVDMLRFNEMYPDYKKKFRFRAFPNQGDLSTWNTQYDGLLYFEKMDPCIKITR